VRTCDVIVVGGGLAGVSAAKGLQAGAGLATRDLCEGIGPAIRSGQRAARAIVSGTPYTLEDVTGASLGGGLISRSMDWAFTRGANLATA
jgi:flavin-dependent dehydrogenase